MVRLGLVALDGTKVEANAAAAANRTHGHLQAQVAERLARLQQAKAQLEVEAAARQRRYQQRVAELAATAQARGQRPGPTSGRGGVMRPQPHGHGQHHRP